MSRMFDPYFMMWQKTFDFQSRTKRRAMIHALIIHGLIFLDIWLLNYFEKKIMMTDFGQITMIMAIVYFLISWIPFTALLSRRLIDAGSKPAYLWFLFVPFAGWIVLVVQLSSKSIVT